MKKIILIISLVISFVGVSLIALPFLLNLSGLSKPVKRYLLASAGKDLQYTINLDNFRIGLGTLDFNNLALKSNNKRYLFTINHIRLSYRLVSLILHPQSPLNALKSVTLIQPKLVIRKENAIAKSGDTTGIWLKLQSIVKHLSRGNQIKFVRVENGKIIFRQQLGDSLIIAEHLNGIIETESERVITIGMHGGLFSDEEDQITLSGRINLPQERMRLLCNLKNYDVKNSFISQVLPQKIGIKGLISGWVLLENHHFDPDSLQINSELNFKNFVFNYHDRLLEDLRFKAVVSNNYLIVDSLKGRFDKATVNAKAWVANIFKPSLQAKVKFANLNPETIVQSGNNHWYAHTSLSGNLDVDIHPKPWRGRLALGQGMLRFNSGKVLNNLKLNFRFSPDTMQITELFARLGKDNLLKGQAVFSPSKGKLAMDLHAEHFTSHHVIFDRLSRKTHTLDITLNSNLKSHTVFGHWAYLLAAPADTLFNLKGQIAGNQQKLFVNVLQSSIPNFSASLRLNDYLHNPNIDQANVLNFPFCEFTSDPMLSKILKRFDNTFRMSGPLNRLKLNLALTDRENQKNQMRILATLSNLFSAHRSLDGMIRLKNITGHSKIDFSDDFLKGEFDFGKQVMGKLNVDFTRKQYLSGALRFNHFNIMQAFSDSVIADNFHFLGNIQGSVLLRGDLKNPMLALDLTGDRFVFNDVGYYQGLLKAFATKDSVNVDSLAISINNLPVIQGKGKVDLKTNVLQGFFFGHDVDVEQFLTSLLKNQSHISGQANYTLGVKGTLTQPLWDLNLNMSNGFLDRVAYDHLFLHIKNHFKEGGSLFNGKNQELKIDKLEIDRTGHYHVGGLGQIPLYSSGAIDFYVNFDGDLFEILPLYQPFFKKGVSKVNLHLALGGTPEHIRISSGYLAINQGELWLKNVAPHIENISGVIEKKSGSNQVNFVNFMASTGGETLTINTVRDVKLPNGESLHPWYFKGLDLDFGILDMATTGHGVRLHLPGFMRPKEFGRLALSGFEPKEHFYFAGPAGHPRLRGKVKIYNTHLTFPFLPIKGAHGGKRDVVVEFLENIDWDLQVVAGEDVVYFRDIPAYIDNVNTELFVDESSPGLHLRGILNNHTFRVSGKLSSSRGRLEYLDQTFRVDYFSAEFTQSSPYPFISGQAWTTIRDSIGAVPKTVYLKLYAVDPETHQEKQQGSLENFKFKLVSADPQIGEDQEQVLSYLGFSMGNLREKATSVGGAVTDKYLFRPLFRPIERAIEHNLGIDFVRINSNIAKNLFYTSIGYGGRNFGRNQPLINPFNTSMPYLFLMSSSEVTLGKYLTQNLYLTYTGQLVSVYDQKKPTFDMNHSFGIEYRFLRNILLEIEYDRELMGYYKIPNQKQYLEDIKIRLRHSFTF